MPQEVKTSSFLTMYLWRILVAITLIAVGSLLVASDPNIEEQIFGGGSIGLGGLAAALLAIDIFKVNSFWITPGADQCDG